MKKKILITGCCGFIGSFLCKKLAEDGNYTIYGIDNMNDYYAVSLKQYRLNQIYEKDADFVFFKADLADKEYIDNLFSEYHFDIVVNLAAQAGVRYSIENPDVYIQSNIIGFYNLLQAIRNNKVEHLIYASSSSVYGNSNSVPFSTDDRCDFPVSLYAASKKTDELLAYTYSHLYAIPVTGLRFFTVYGPLGRPDMAYFSFTDKLLNKEKIKVFNNGKCERDFTYIDDIVEGICKVIEKGPMRSYNLYNIGNSHPENLLDFIYTLATCLKENGLLTTDFEINDYLEMVPMQAGDVEKTYADVSGLENDYGFRPATPLKQGLNEFAKWYKDYYKCDKQK